MNLNEILLRSRIKVSQSGPIDSGNIFKISVFLESEISHLPEKFDEFKKWAGAQFKAKALLFIPPNADFAGASADNNELIYFLPAEGARGLAGALAGEAHKASAWGAQLAAAILNATSLKGKKIALELSAESLVSIRNSEGYFLLGMTQRSLQNKLNFSKNNVAVDKLESVIFCFVNKEQFNLEQIKFAEALSDSMTLTRSLVNAPPNMLNPEFYEQVIRQKIQQECDLSGNKAFVKMEVIDAAQLKKDGCGLICAVGQGSDVPPRILKLTYNSVDNKKENNQKNKKHVAIVGKGVTFDTGGLDIKGSSFMRNMKKDMGGSAAAAGVFFAAARLQIPLKITCYLALAENMISGAAMRPGDVYCARNGLSVEIDNTDAEGRLVLADALCYAQDEKPDWTIDLATLTGAARVALGPWVDGLFGNNCKLNDLIKESSAETGDWVWQLPLVDDYEPMFDSSVAHMTNSAVGGHAGAITAALFLRKFAGQMPWTHIDTYMWTDKPQDLVAEPGGTSKCVRLIVHALSQFAKQEN